ncbi:MAG: hypothetical protein JW797_12305 [Bradymonadales bacterium]|nr:hypothetical protein [Bradymonadales bacterium]
MDDWIWCDEQGELGFRVDDSVEAPELVLFLNEQPLANLSRNDAANLATALRRWAAGENSAAEASFLVYYVHEYLDEQGQLLECEALGDCDEENSVSFNEPDIAAVRRRVAWIGQQLAELHAAYYQIELPEELPEKARAWVSIFRMPEDVRVWKGFADELPDTPDDQLVDGT